MNSKIAEAIKLRSHPVAVLYEDHTPEDALQFTPGRRACVISLLIAASKGRTAAFTKETTPCPGGKAGLGFDKFPPFLENLLSSGNENLPGEFYKKTPELVKNYISGFPRVEKSNCVVLKPLDLVMESETPLAVIFLVNADQLSGLVTLANFDSPTQENVKIHFGAGCAQAICYAAVGNQLGNKDCFIGLTDPSARKYVDKDLLSFTIPYCRYLEMESNVENSFLVHETWQSLSKRIEQSRD